jgi:hypothetical protein
VDCGDCGSAGAIANDAAPGVGAVGIDVFVLSDLDGLQKCLAEVGEDGSFLGFDFAWGGVGKDFTLCAREITGSLAVHR